MRTIHTALPVLANRHPSFAFDFRLMHKLLTEHGQGLVEMPTGVLTTAFETIGLAPRSTQIERAIAGDPVRALCLTKIASDLSKEGHISEPIQMAVGVWSVLAARAGATYRANMGDTQARHYAAFLTRTGFELSVIVARAEQVRVHGLDRIANVRAVLRENPQLRKSIAEMGAVEAQLTLGDRLRTDSPELETTS